MYTMFYLINYYFHTINNLIYTYLYHNIFYFLNKISRHYLNNNDSSMAVGFINNKLQIATCILYITGKYNYNNVVNIANGYYLYDGLNELYNRKSNMKYVYIMHHITTSYLLSNSKHPKVYGSIYFLAELSNMPLYTTYFFLKYKHKYSRNFINNIKLYHFLHFSFIRLILGFYSTYYVLILNDINQIEKWLSLFMYTAGIQWSYNFYNNLYIKDNEKDIITGL